MDINKDIVSFKHRFQYSISILFGGIKIKVYDLIICI